MIEEFCNLGPEPIERTPTLMFTLYQIETTKPPNTFTTQDAAMNSNAELDQLWNRILFSKHSVSRLWEKLLATPLMDLTHLTMMKIQLMKIRTIHYHWFTGQTYKSYSSFYTYMVFRCFYCTVWISMLHFTSMWNIF